MVDVTINASPRTIRLKDYGVRHERPVYASSTVVTIVNGVTGATGAIIPGSLLQYKSDGSFDVQTTADKKAAAVFALENELIGKGIDDFYLQGDLIQAEHFDSGDWVLAYLAPSATAVVVGSLLVAANNGSLKIIGGDDQSEAVAISMDAVDNSAGASIARVRVAIL